MARAKTATIGAGVGVDTRDLSAFTRQLRKASVTAAVGLRESLRASGEIVAEEARQIAAEHSQTIPGTIKVSVRGATVSVTAGGRGVPIAALYELGNKGSAQDSTTFRHPIFGNRDAWTTQARYPFLRPATRHKSEAVQAEVVKVADKVASTLSGHTQIF